MPNEQDPAARGNGHEPSDVVQRLRDALARERMSDMHPSFGLFLEKATHDALAAVEREMAELRSKADACDEVDADAEAERAGMEEALLAAGVEDDPHCGLPSIIDNAVKLIAALEKERTELRKERDARPTLEEAERSVCAVFLPGDYVIGQRGHARDSVLDAVRALYAEKAKATEAQHG